MEKVTIQLNTLNRSVIKNLFGSTNPKINTRSKVDGIGEIILSGMSIRPGMTTEDILITIIINVSTGVPTGLLANWIFQKLSKNGENSIRIGNDPIVKTGEKEIISALERKE